MAGNGRPLAVRKDGEPLRIMVAQLVMVARMKKRAPVNEKNYRIGQHHHNAVLTDADVELVRILRERDGTSYGWLTPACHHWWTSMHRAIFLNLS